VVTIPLFLAVGLAAALGAGLWFAALNVKYRDVRYVLPFIVQLWLFASPVAYSASLIDSPTGRALFALNPMAGVIQGFRWALIGGPPPGDMVWPSVVVALLLLVSGMLFFKRTEDTFADVI
jgi:lipopolysaccharide transport system permease protein